jgi:Domain of unknown function (DUF4156)
MQFVKKIIALSVTATFLVGCASSFIEVRSGSENVSVLEAQKVTSCELKGKVTSSVLSKVGFISRSVESVEENLLQMAKNGAVEDGGDTLVKGESTEFGKRNFSIYKCKH